MSSARFLLEFEATGDQEVVNAVKEVGTAGKKNSHELESLQGIEDPFSSLSEGADNAIGPIQEVGSATAETVAPLEDMGGTLQTNWVVSLAKQEHQRQTLLRIWMLWVGQPMPQLED